MNKTAEALDQLAAELLEWRDAGGPVGEVANRIMELVDTRILASRNWVVINGEVK